MVETWETPDVGGKLMLVVSLTPDAEHKVRTSCSVWGDHLPPKEEEITLVIALVEHAIEYLQLELKKLKPESF